MYSHKQSVNILTALLVGHGVRHAVVCPGSRNAPIVHNLNECPDVRCYPVTDERSAGFYALGMMQALNEPVCVCVTSGTALLNLAPAVAEAWYQHQPLIVVSADRPEAWIDQLDGQTLPQPGSLGRFVRRVVSLPESDSCSTTTRDLFISTCPSRNRYSTSMCRSCLKSKGLSVHRPPATTTVSVLSSSTDWWLPVGL